MAELSILVSISLDEFIATQKQGTLDALLPSVSHLVNAFILNYAEEGLSICTGTSWSPATIAASITCGTNTSDQPPETTNFIQEDMAQCIGNMFIIYIPDADTLKVFVTIIKTAQILQ